MPAIAQFVRIIAGAVVMCMCGFACVNAQTAVTAGNTEMAEVTICQLSQHPKNFRGKLVRLRARFETAVIEGGIWLIDDTCPKYGLELAVPAAIRNRPASHLDYAALENAYLRTGSLGTADKRITGLFTGRLIKSSNQMHLSMVYERVDDLEVKLNQP
jgi:hypothetical protein